jgi:hypothetical protein
MDKKKVIIVIGGLAAVGTALYFIFRKRPDTSVGSIIDKVSKTFGGEELSDKPVVGSGKSKPTGDIISPPSSTTTTKSYPCPSYKAESFPLSVKMKGEKTKALQLALNKVYKQNLVVDGCFGPNTKTAVKAVIGRDTVKEQDFASIISSYSALMIMKPLG